MNDKNENLKSFTLKTNKIVFVVFCQPHALLMNVYLAKLTFTHVFLPTFYFTCLAYLANRVLWWYGPPFVDWAISPTSGFHQKCYSTEISVNFNQKPTTLINSA